MPNMSEASAVEGMSYQDYSDKPGLRSGYLAEIIKGSPGLAEYHRAHQITTPALNLGKALHSLILEPQTFADTWAIGGPVNPKTGNPYGVETKAFQEWESEQGKPVMSHAQHRALLGMAESIAAHPLARTIRDAPRKTELSLFWELEETPCKARIDCLQDGVVWDIKTTRDASYRGFERSISEYRYHMSAAWYLDGARRAGLIGMDCKFLWLAIENVPPYALCVYRAIDELLEVGHILCVEAFDQYVKCEQEKHFPTAYAQEEVLMNAPRWMIPSEESLEA